MFRAISLYIRKKQSQKENARTINTWREWESTIKSIQIKAPSTDSKKLLIIRLDDIGDYILFRNTLKQYRTSLDYKTYSITLLGNVAWKSIFETYDADLVDQTIWVQKNNYYDDAGYRMQLWQMLAKQGYHTVICPSYTRPLLLDDACMLACNATLRIGNKNTFSSDSINDLSNQLYNNLFDTKDLMHEYSFNCAFAEWVTNIKPENNYPTLSKNQIQLNNSIICFIGASAKSKRWPNKHWITLINCIKAKGLDVCICGGPSDVKNGAEIAVATGVNNLVAQLNLVDMLTYIGGSKLTISNDTMAAHAAASFGINTIILSAGDNFYRFGNYASIGMQHVHTYYPTNLLNELKTKQISELKFYTAVSKDIYTIYPSTILEIVDKLV